MSLEQRMEKLEYQVRRYRRLAVVLIVVLVAIVTMAQTSTLQNRWKLQAGRFGSNSFYAIKFNPQTGESLVLSGERGAKDDSWLRLPVRTARDTLIKGTWSRRWRVEGEDK